MTISLVDSDHLEWEAYKFGPRAVLVLALSSGHFVVAEQGRQVIAVAESLDELADHLQRAASRPDDYTPPTAAPVPTFLLDEEDDEMKLRI